MSEEEVRNISEIRKTIKEKWARRRESKPADYGEAVLWLHKAAHDELILTGQSDKEFKYDIGSRVRISPTANTTDSRLDVLFFGYVYGSGVDAGDVGKVGKIVHRKAKNVQHKGLEFQVNSYAVAYRPLIGIRHDSLIGKSYEILRKRTVTVLEKDLYLVPQK